MAHERQPIGAIQVEASAYWFREVIRNKLATLPMIWQNSSWEERFEAATVEEGRVAIPRFEFATSNHCVMNRAPCRVQAPKRSRSIDRGYLD